MAEDKPKPRVKYRVWRGQLGRRRTLAYVEALIGRGPSRELERVLTLFQLAQRRLISPRDFWARVEHVFDANFKPTRVKRP